MFNTKKCDNSVLLQKFFCNNIFGETLVYEKIVAGKFSFILQSVKICLTVINRNLPFNFTAQIAARWPIQKEEQIWNVAHALHNHMFGVNILPLNKH